MTKAEYIEFHKKFCEEMVNVTRKKNADYTGSGDDPFANFKQIGHIITAPNAIEIGFLTRISDKLSRLASFVEKGSYQVSDESFQDTCLDAANYFALLAGYSLSKPKEIK